MTERVAKSVWFTAPRTAEVREVAVPAPRNNELLVEAVCSLVSPGTEMLFYRGESGEEVRKRLIKRGALSTLESFPIKFGYQVIGRVASAPSTGEYEVGELVFAPHPHQSLFSIPVTSVHRVRPGLDPRQAAFTNMNAVAVSALLDAPVRIGDCVVVVGLGLIGRLTAHLARRTAGALILIDPIESRRELAASVGADAVVGPPEAAAAIAELSEGRGADVTFETSGTAVGLQSSLEHTGVEGTVCVVAYYGTKSLSLQLEEFHIRRHRLVSSQVSMIGSGLQPRWDFARRYDVSMDTLAGLGSETLITHEFPLDRAPEAYHLIDARSDETLGVLLVYDDAAVTV